MRNTAVIYVPKYIQISDMSKFDFNHPRCEYGIIKNANEKFVFVNYVINGIPQNTAKATYPNDLFFLDGTSILDAFEIFKLIKDETLNSL